MSSFPRPDPGKRQAQIPAVGAALVVVLASATIGLLIVASASLGTSQQLLIAMAAGAAALGVAAWLARPELVLAAFILALPLMQAPAGDESGVNPAELATLSIVALGMLSIATLRFTEKSNLRPIVWTLVALAAVGLVTAVVNHAFGAGELAAAAFKPLSWAVVLYLIVLHFRTQERLRGLLVVLVFGATLVGIYAVFQYATGAGDAPANGGPVRVAGTFEHWNQLGGFMAMMVFPTFGLALSVAGAKRALLFGAATVQLIALLLSLTLGSIFAIALAGVVGVVLVSRLAPQRAVALAALPLLVLLALSVFNPALLDRFGEAGERTTDRLSGYAAGVELARDNFWTGTGSLQIATREIRRRPEYRFAFQESSSLPHNPFILIWVQSGVVALGLLVLLAWFAFRVLLRSRAGSGGKDPLTLGLLLGALAFLIQNFTNNLMIHSRLGLLFLVLIVIMARLTELRAGSAARPSAGVA